MGETSEVVATAAETDKATSRVGLLWTLIITALALLALMGWLTMIKQRRYDDYISIPLTVVTIISTVLTIAAIVAAIITMKPLYN